MNNNEARAKKRRDSHTWYTRELPDGTVERDPYDCGRRTLPASVGHIPNKNEAKALRRICSQTGLTPEQVRQNKTYRQQLAEAAGPQFRTHDAAKNRLRKMYPWMRIKDPLERDKARFAQSVNMDVKHKHFERLYAEELKRREEQAIIDKLSGD